MLWHSKNFVILLLPFVPKLGWTKKAFILLVWIWMNCFGFVGSIDFKWNDYRARFFQFPNTILTILKECYSNLLFTCKKRNDTSQVIFVSNLALSLAVVVNKREWATCTQKSECSTGNCQWGKCFFLPRSKSAHCFKRQEFEAYTK